MPALCSRGRHYLLSSMNISKTVLCLIGDAISSQAGHYTSILEKTVQNKRQWVPHSWNMQKCKMEDCLRTIYIPHLYSILSSRESSPLCWPLQFIRQLQHSPRHWSRHSKVVNSQTPPWPTRRKTKAILSTITTLANKLKPTQRPSETKVVFLITLAKLTLGTGYIPPLL